MKMNFVLGFVAGLVVAFNVHNISQFLSQFESSGPNLRQLVEQTLNASGLHLQQKQPTATFGNGHLSCGAHGGPLETALTQEMVYWRDIPSDRHYQSPFLKKNSGGQESSQRKTKYLLFEREVGGRSSMRMALENMAVLALTMGRTLVLPPQNSRLGDFSAVEQVMNISAIHQTHEGLDIITTEEFINRQLAMKKEDRDMNIGDHSKPHKNAHDWYEHLTAETTSVIWDPNKCFVVVPPSSGAVDVKPSYKNMLDGVLDPKHFYIPDAPTPLKASDDYRFAEFRADRKELCLYIPVLQETPVLFFPAKNDDVSDDWDPRLVAHFYSFLFFSDIHQDLQMKRFVRDNLRYIDEIQCAAARVVAALREQVRALPHQQGGPDGLFHSMHVPRGSDLPSHARIASEELLQVVAKRFKDGDVVFIASDEQDKSYFEPLQEHYHVFFLHHFIDGGTVGEGVNPNYFGLMEQLIAARGNIFFGCRSSKVTAYITRLRGYHSQLRQEPGYQDGELPTTFFYAPKDAVDDMTRYRAMHAPVHEREYPTAWRLIDRDVEEEWTGYGNTREA